MDKNRIRAKGWAESVWKIIINSKNKHLKKIRKRSSKQFKDRVTNEAEELVYLNYFTHYSCYNNLISDPLVRRELLSELYKYVSEYAIKNNCNSIPWSVWKSENNISSADFNLNNKTPLQNLKMRLDLYQESLEKTEGQLPGTNATTLFLKWTSSNSPQLKDSLKHNFIHWFGATRRTVDNMILYVE
jgi:hypothetical protein